MTTALQISHNILGFFGFVSRWTAQHQQRRAEEKRKNTQYEQELAERERTERLLFLKLLQTMCKVCEQLKPLPWVHEFGGWDPPAKPFALCHWTKDIPIPTPQYTKSTTNPHGCMVEREQNIQQITIE